MERTHIEFSQRENTNIDVVICVCSYVWVLTDARNGVRKDNNNSNNDNKCRRMKWKAFLNFDENSWWKWVSICCILYTVYCLLYKRWNSKHSRSRLDKQKVLHTHIMQVEKAHSKVEWRAYNVTWNAIKIQLFTMSTETNSGSNNKKWKKY